MVPCALCSACRDWNLGEFCPWDLTGIIGDISSSSISTTVSDVFDGDEDSALSMDTAIPSPSNGSVTAAANADARTSFGSLDAAATSTSVNSLAGATISPGTTYGTANDVGNTDGESKSETFPQEIKATPPIESYISTSAMMVDIETWN